MVYPLHCLCLTIALAGQAPEQDSASSVAGQIRSDKGRPVAGALVQAYCVDGSPDCKDPTTKSTENLRPTAEAVTGADGTFRLVVPDPVMVY